jgi:lysophospholipase L1-like esterase
VHVDEIAFEEYRALLGELRARGVRLVAVVPPTIEDLIGPRRDRMTRYARRVLALFSPEDLVVDFDRPEHAALRSDPGNFRDGVHLSSRGAQSVVRALDARLLAWRGKP